MGRMRRLALWSIWIFAAGLAVVLATTAAVVVVARGSLPPLEGSFALEGLSAPAVLERDTLGIAVVRAASLRDAYRIQGYAHGQDRFFQMDLLRRFVAGELAALVGAEALNSDRDLRQFQYRTAAAGHLARLSPSERDDLVAYVEGVNAGLGSLKRKPPEYWLLRAAPEPWTEEDALLVYLYFYIALSTHHREEANLYRMAQVLPEAWVDFLTPEMSRFDQPLLGLLDGDPRGGYTPQPIPGPEHLDLRAQMRSAGARADVDDSRAVFRIFGDLVEPTPEMLPGGSNAWAVRGFDGPALVAGDPHLAHQVPGVWYRVELHWPEGVARGVSPPGLPGVFLGMTDHLGWGVTAAVVDQTDLIAVSADMPIEAHREWIQVLRGDSVAIELERTAWGPVVHNGLALRSPAYDPGGITLTHLALLERRTVAEAVEVARQIGGPTLGLVFGDAAGQTAWVVSGQIPRRVGHTGRRVVEFGVGASAGAEAGAEAGAGAIGWAGVRPEEERPVLMDPDVGYVFTANQRFAQLEVSESLSAYWMPPMRARRLHALLEVDARPEEPLHLSYQLDTRSLEHEQVRALVIELLAEGAGAGAGEGAGDDPALQRLLNAARTWDGDADVDDTAFADLERARIALRGAALGPLVALVAERFPDFRYTWLGGHEAAYRVLEAKPNHLLPPEWEDWEAYLREALRAGLEGRPEVEWGEINRARILHPFSGIHPWLDARLNLPDDRLPGWAGVLRAQQPSYGQSLRFVGRPGMPERAYLQLPGGQSGHFLSPFYQAGHRAWVEGTPGPLMAGPARAQLQFTPTR